MGYSLTPSAGYEMIAPTSQAIPKLQRESATLQLPKPHPYSARNILQGVFRKTWEAPPRVQKVQAEHAQVLLKTPIGRDFALITAAGVEFTVHSIMLIGGSKMLQNGLFPCGAPHPNPPSVVNLPPHFHPILVDRVVNFIYTSNYDFDPKSSSSTELKPENFTFPNATFVPNEDPPAPAVISLVGIRACAYHLHMYALAEELDYDALKSVSHAKLLEQLVTRRGQRPSSMKEIIDAIFTPPGSEARICKDEDGVLQQLVVAGVIAHYSKDWLEKHRQEFDGLLRGPKYADFCNAHAMIRAENMDLIKFGETNRILVAERKKARKERMAGKSGAEDKVTSTRSPVQPVNSRVGNRPKNLFEKKQPMQSKFGVATKTKIDVDGYGYGDGDMQMDMD